MRDFRDAKAMAQTLRDTLDARSVSLTHSESQELIAKVLGFRDWNVLAARIQSESDGPNSPAPGSGSRSGLPQDLDASGKPVRQEIVVDAAILDEYVGFYQLNDTTVFTVTRHDNQFVTQLSGQREVPIYAQSKTEFFAKIVDAQISFITDPHGQAVSLILHQNGRDVPMARINATATQQISDRLAKKLNSDSASLGTESALLRLVNGIVSGNPNYDEMSSELAEATRQQWSALRSDVGESGPVQSIRFVGVGSRGEDVYVVTQVRRAWHWRIAPDLKGTRLPWPGSVQDFNTNASKRWWMKS